MLAIRLTSQPGQPEIVAIPVGPGAQLPATQVVLADDVRAEAAAFVAAQEHDGSPGTVETLPRPLRSPRRILLVGVGDGDEAGWRTAGAAIARTAGRASALTVAMPADAPPAAVRGLAEGLWLAEYRFRPPGAPDSPDRSPELAEVLVAVAEPGRHSAALDAARAAACAGRLARTLTNMPSSVKNPAWFADEIRAIAAAHPGVTVSVKDADRLSAEGFGGLLAVGGGSASGPRLLEVRWQPQSVFAGRAGEREASAYPHVVLVGKGITFDTGGISIKPRDAMKLMRKDMGGAAAVVAATIGAAVLGLPVRVTALAPLAENMPSGTAFRPGDVIRHYGGTTSESTNTDAEGRLVLADALAYAVDQLAPDLLVDLATLTGANAVALGKRTAALYSDNDDLAGAIAEAAAAAGERVWRMPLPTDYAEYLASDIADLYSAPDRGAGSVVAALYLREFTGDLRDRWVHIDMSAPSWSDSPEAELTKGATGWGARAVLRWLESLDSAVSRG
ncbi:MAG TPA: leucyl aminopeptidase family protein [Micromonosporaceae bacterium]|nr:leucyl aminopeptidase family protein [Micromonosporaceae bacterium]